MNLYFRVIFLLLALILVACGSDDVNDAENNARCPGDEVWNPINGQCIQSASNNDQNPSNANNSVSNSDGNNQTDLNANTPDVNNHNNTENNSADNNNLDCTTDNDGDGYISVECGGDDCDDNDARIHPDAVEICSFRDNNCSGTTNDDLDCSFYAHTTDALYRVDPFLATLEEVMSVPQNLFDIDTHPDGTLYGISSMQLFRFRPGDSQWSVVGNFNFIGNANGLCIESSGRAYITASQTLYTVDLDTAASSSVGSIGYTSSGDCVITKGDVLYMSASNGLGNSFNGDGLVMINGQTATSTAVGSIGHNQIYGLTAAWGYLFGLSGNGELVSIDVNTGQGTHLHTFPGHTFYGAASSPGR